VADKPGESPSKAANPGSRPARCTAETDMETRPKFRVLQNRVLSFDVALGRVSLRLVNHSKDTTKFGKPVTSSVTVRIPTVTVAEARARAGRAGVSMTELLNTALARYLTQK